MNTLSHYQFSPWTVDGDRRIVASADQWAEVVKLNEQAGVSGERQRIEVTVDVFEDWDGALEFSGGSSAYICGECGWWKTIADACCSSVDHVSLVMQDVIGRLFKLIDATPNLNWLLTTKRPERVGGLVPYHWVMPNLSKIPEDVKKEIGWPQTGFPENVWLGVRVSTQAEADERIPHLLKVPAAVRFVRCTPREAISLSPYRNAEGNVVVTQGIDCDLVIVSGESGPDSRPMHPDWVRSLRDQCTGAGVPFWFESWGEWWPYFADDDDMAATYEDAVGNISTSDHGDFPTGFDCGNPAEAEYRWPKKYPNSDDMQSSFRVGKNRAGRTLDGRTWGELPTTIGDK
jgi:protein gp37